MHGAAALWVADSVVLAGMPATSAAQPVWPTGVTRVSAGPVEVVMTTRVATPEENSPSHATRCSGGWVPCSLVDTLSIRIDGKAVAVPDRAVVLLADVSSARITPRGPGRYTLILRCGDAGASYEARLFFDRNRVHRLEIWSGEMKVIEQVTDYHDVAADLARQ